MLGIVQSARDARFRDLRVRGVGGVGGVGADGHSVDLALADQSVDDEGGVGLEVGAGEGAGGEGGAEVGAIAGEGVAVGGTSQGNNPHKERQIIEAGGGGQGGDGARRVIEIGGVDKKGARKGALGAITEEVEEGEGLVGVKDGNGRSDNKGTEGNEVTEGGDRGGEGVGEENSSAMRVTTTDDEGVHVDEDVGIEEDSPKSGVRETPYFSEQSPKSGLRPRSAMPMVMSGPFLQRSVIGVGVAGGGGGGGGGGAMVIGHKQEQKQEHQQEPQQEHQQEQNEGYQQEQKQESAQRMGLVIDTASSPVSTPLGSSQPLLSTSSQRLLSTPSQPLLSSSSSRPSSSRPSSSQPLSVGNDNIRVYLKPPMSGGPPQPSLPPGAYILLECHLIFPYHICPKTYDSNYILLLY